MSIKTSVMHTAGSIFFDRPGRSKTPAQGAEALEKSCTKIDERAASAKDAQRAGSVLRHITGIERWGQSRLRVFLGAPLVQDEYDVYQPGPDLALEGQRQAFRETRQETIELAHELDTVGIADTVTVPHNDFGPFTVGGWLRYIDSHAKLESTKIR